MNAKATMQYYKVMKNSGNMSSTQDNNSPITKLKGMEFCDLTDNKFKTVVLEKLSKQQENSERQFNKISVKYVNKMRHSPKK